MRIDYNVHLDYSDVLLKPKRSTLSSRRDVDINREFNYDARVSNIPDLNVGSVTESVTVDAFDSGTPDMFDSVFDYMDLKKKYPALQQAWDHYQSVLKMCKLKESEDKR